MSGIGVSALDLLGIGRSFPRAPRGSGLRTVRGDSGLPVVGHGLNLLRDSPGWARQRYDRYGPVSWFSGLGKRGVVVLGPEGTENVFQNRDKAFGNTAAWELATGPFVRRGLLRLEFDEHRQHRKIMQQAFTRDRLRGYLEDMNPAISQGMEHWPYGEVRLSPTIKKLSLDLAGKIFIGDELGDEITPITRAFQAMLDGAAAFVRYPVPGLNWSKGLAGRRMLEEVMYSRLPAKRAGNGADLFSALCHAQSDEGEVFTDQDVVNHMIFILFAAHDTSTATMNTMCYHLAREPEWQERCREESIALGKDHIDYDDLDKLPSLDLVMKESLRMIVPISVTFRQTVKDTEVLGHYLPKDTWTLLVPQFTHNMHEYFPNPERFDPERFSEERREDKIHRYAWAPFGGGAHKCIGMYFAGLEVKAILHQMLLRFQWEVEPGYRTTFDFSRLPVPKDGLRVRLLPRRTASTTTGVTRCQ